MERVKKKNSCSCSKDNYCRVVSETHKLGTTDSDTYQWLGAKLKKISFPVSKNKHFAIVSLITAIFSAILGAFSSKEALSDPPTVVLLAYP